MPSNKLIVLKIGGSVLTSEQTLRLVVHEIYRWRRDGYNVVAVVSALSGVTDSLLEKCQRLAEKPTPQAVAAIVATGELQSAAFLGLHLDRAGIPASILSAESIRLTAEGPPLDAAPVRLNDNALRRALNQDGLVVLPGYIAVNPAGRTVLLGRGGSDLSALFIAARLNAEKCRLIKDVDGLYERDPAIPGPPPKRYRNASWDDALKTDGSIVQRKAVRFARSNRVQFELGRINADDPTRVGSGPTDLDQRRETPRKLRVALLGLGAVGGGVLTLLQDLPQFVEIVGAAVRCPSAARHPNLPPELLSQDPVALAESDSDLVIESIGGVDLAGQAVERALRRGANVITANKTLIAQRGQELELLARQNRVFLSFSAAVGGVVPILERLNDRDSNRPSYVRAVLNGTTNFILEQLAGGLDFDAALAEAQRRGFAEADPSRDLDGRDAADKLALVAAGLGHHNLPPSTIERDPLTPETIFRLQRSSPKESIVRQVAALDCRNGAPNASVRLVPLDPADPLYSIRDENNAALIERDDGSIELLRGKGAGRWPTAEAVVADFLEISRILSAAHTNP